MRKQSIAVLTLGMLLFVYCSPKTGKELAKTEAITEVVPAKVERTAEEFARGRVLMEENCGGCHVLFEPEDFKGHDWDEILKSMLPQAKLSGENAHLVRDYIMAHARDAAR